MPPFESNVRINITTPTDDSERSTSLASTTNTPGDELSTSPVNTKPSEVSVEFVPRLNTSVVASFNEVPISNSTEVFADDASSDDDVRIVADSENGSASDSKFTKNRYLLASTFIK